MSVTFNGGIRPIIIHLWEIEQKTAPQKKKKRNNNFPKFIDVSTFLVTNCFFCWMLTDLKSVFFSGCSTLKLLFNSSWLVLTHSAALQSRIFVSSPPSHQLQILFLVSVLSSERERDTSVFFLSFMEFKVKRRISKIPE